MNGTKRATEAAGVARHGRRASRDRAKGDGQRPLDEARARTETDTGRRDEHSQALERTLVKELGNITP